MARITPKMIQQTGFRYSVTTTHQDTDDYGDDQFSLYIAKVHSEVELSKQQVVDMAEEQMDWRIWFGEGEEELVDKYEVECLNHQTGQYTML